MTSTKFSVLTTINSQNGKLDKNEVPPIKFVNKELPLQPENLQLDYEILKIDVDKRCKKNDKVLDLIAMPQNIEKTPKKSTVKRLNL